MIWDVRLQICGSFPELGQYWIADLSADTEVQNLSDGCKEGAEARRFNRLLIDAGLINGL